MEQKWEYLARDMAGLDGALIETDFNDLGDHGWEFVGMAGTHAIFKRPR